MGVKNMMLLSKHSRMPCVASGICACKSLTILFTCVVTLAMLLLLPHWNSMLRRLKLQGQKQQKR